MTSQLRHARHRKPRSQRVLPQTVLTGALRATVPTGALRATVPTGPTPAGGRHRSAPSHTVTRPVAVAGALTVAAGMLAAPAAAQAAAPASAPRAVSAPAAAPASVGVRSAHGGVVLAGQTLLPGHTLVNRGIRLHLSTSGDLLLYSARGALLWASHTAGHHGATATMQEDGNFVLRNRSGYPVWSTRTGVDGSRLIVLKAAVLAVQSRSGRLVWSVGARATTAPASTPTTSSPQSFAISELPVYGWSGGQWPCLQSLWQRESGWNYRAMNASSGAYGIPQSLPGSKMAAAGADWRYNPATQIRWGLSYIKSVYGSPCGAWAHSQGTGWY